MSNEIIEEILTKNPPLKHTYVAQNHEIEKARCIKYARTIARKVVATILPPDGEKPSINEVTQAFHGLHGDVRRAMYHNKGNDTAALAEIDIAYAQLREKLTVWGMADLIDWSKED